MEASHEFVIGVVEVYQKLDSCIILSIMMIIRIQFGKDTAVFLMVIAIGSSLFPFLLSVQTTKRLVCTRLM